MQAKTPNKTKKNKKEKFYQKLNGTYVDWEKFLDALKLYAHEDNPSTSLIRELEIETMITNPKNACLMIMFVLDDAGLYPHRWPHEAGMYASLGGALAEDAGATWLIHRKGGCPTDIGQLAEELGKEDLCPHIISQEYEKFRNRVALRVKK